MLFAKHFSVLVSVYMVIDVLYMQGFAPGRTKGQSTKMAML